VSELKVWRQTITLPVQPSASALSATSPSGRPRAVLLFDIDGVLRDVAGSYRRAIRCTVRHFCGWTPDPADIDALKSEGRWNNDWEASRELIRRRDAAAVPAFAELVAVFGDHYFGGDPDGDPTLWRGYIGSEPLLVEGSFFEGLTAAGIAWGFVSGAEPPSCHYVLETRLGLVDPPLIAMGDAPDKPDPTGLLRLAQRLSGDPLGADAVPVAYLGDTVADVETVLRARAALPDQRLLSLAVAPPHLQVAGQEAARAAYEERLRQAGADRVLGHTGEVAAVLLNTIGGA
jgi:HAD superfamily phosphatase